MATMVSFIVGLKSPAARAETASPERLAHRMRATYGEAQLYEWYKSSIIGKPMFDVDGKADVTTAEQLLADALAGITTFFGFTPPNIIIASSHSPPGTGNKLSYRLFVPGFRMLVADMKKRLVRLGLDKNRPFDGAIYGANQKLRMVGSFKTPDDRRVLALVDREPTEAILLDTLVQVTDPSWPLLAEPPLGPTAGPLTAIFTNPTKPTKPSKRPPPPASSGSDSDSDEPVEATGPPASLAPQAPASTAVASTSAAAKHMAIANPPKRQRGRPRSKDQMPPDLVLALDQNGFVNIRSSKAVDRGFTFDCDNHDQAHPCPCCKAVHTSNQFYANDRSHDFYRVGNFSDSCKALHIRRQRTEIIPAAANVDVDTAFAGLELALPDGQAFAGINDDVHYHRYLVQGTRDQCIACNGTHPAPHTYEISECLKNHAWSIRHTRATESCPGRIWWHDGRLEHYLRPLLEEPRGDAHFADLFLLGHHGILFADRDAGDVKLFERRWHNLSPKQLECLVNSWVRNFINQIRLLPQYAESKPVAEAHKHIQRSTVSKGITSLVGINLAAGVKPEFNGNPLLLGADNAIIDMTATPIVFRRPTPQDFICQTIGYDLPSLAFPDGADEIEEIMAKIYPVEEERRVLQAYAGYCLLGHTDSKVFLALTDRRSGFNGKSTVVEMFKLALGSEYVVKGKNAFLLSTGHVRDMNSHDSGWLDYRHKRLAYFEELGGNHSLDQGRLKDVTGGGTSITVRKAHATESEQMPWSSKLMLIFNEGSFPKFNVDDGAFAQRMLVMQHRSAFLKPDALAATQAPYTYLADEGLKGRLKAAPHKILAWMLQGVHLYNAGRLDDIPASIRRWRNELSSEQDEAQRWLDENLHEAPGQWVTRHDIWCAFSKRCDREKHVPQAQLYAKLKLLPSYVEEQRKKGTASVRTFVDNFALGAKADL